MTIRVVEFDHEAQRAVRIVEDPQDLLMAAHEMWRMDMDRPLTALFTRFMSIEGEVDLEAQTIQGVQIRSIYERHAARRAAAT